MKIFLKKCSSKIKVLSFLLSKYSIKSLCYIYALLLLRKLVNKFLSVIFLLTHLMSFRTGMFFLYLWKTLFKILFDFPSPKVIRKNLMEVMKDKITQKALQTFILNHRKHFFKTLIETKLIETKILVKSSITTINFFKKLVEIEGKENLDRAVKIDKGVILVSAHLGAYRLLPFVLMSLGYNTNFYGLFIGMKKEKYKKELENLKRFFKISSISFSYISYIKEVITFLRKKGIIIIISDVPLKYNEKRSKITVTREKIHFQAKLFNKSVYVPSLHVRICIKVGSPIVPAFLIRTGNIKYKLIINKPIIVENKESKNDFLLFYIKKVYQVINSFIQQYPEQWMYWEDVHKMFV